MKINRIAHLIALGLLIVPIILFPEALGDLAGITLIGLIFIFIYYCTAHKQAMNLKPENTISRFHFLTFSWITVGLIAFAEHLFIPIKEAAVPGPGMLFMFLIFGTLILLSFLFSIIPFFFVKK